MSEQQDDKLEQLFKLQCITLNGLSLVMGQIRHLPMSELNRAAIEAWREFASEYLAKVTKQPPSEFDVPLDDRGLKHQRLGELLRDEAERLRHQPQYPPDELSED